MNKTGQNDGLFYLIRGINILLKVHRSNLCLCANNKELYNDLLKIDNPNLIVKGYVNNINEYMSDSKIVLTKPGGLTSTEVAVMGKPMIHLMPIPGVENYNARFFRKYPTTR